MDADARRVIPPTSPIAEPEPPSRGPSFWGFLCLGMAILAGAAAFGGFFVRGGRDPQWFFPALVIALGVAPVLGILGGVMLLRRPPRSTWIRLVSVSLVLVVGALVIAGVQGIQVAFDELIAG